MKEKELEKRAYERVAQTLREVPFLRDFSIRSEVPRQESRPDFALTIAGGGPKRLIIG